MIKRIIFIVLISFLIGACADKKKSNDKEVKDRDELVLAIGGEPDDGFDPTLGWGRYGSPLFQSTLLKYDTDFKLENDLASDYSVSDDGLEWKVELRDSIKFSDGEPLTVNDVVFTYKKAKESQSVVDLDNVEDIEKEGANTVKFTLKKRNSTFIFYLVTVGIVPEHAYDDNYKENPIGSGPYQLEEWVKGQQIIVKPNPYYYGEEPYFQKLTFLFLSEDSGFAAAKADKVDVVSVPPSFADKKIKGMDLIAIESVDNRGVVLPFLPDEGKKNKEEDAPIGNNVTADKTLRKAMNIGIDREKLVEGALNGYGAPAYTAVDHLPWWNKETEFDDGQVEEAKKILEEGGWKEQENGIREKKGLKAEFELYYDSDDDTRQSLSMAFAQMVEPLGIKVKTKGRDWSAIYKKMHSNAVMLGLGSHTPLELYNAFSENKQGQGLSNVNYYSNETVEDYFKKALEAESQDEAYTYWEKAQWDGETGTTYKGDAPWVWLVNLEHLYFINEDLEIGDQKIHPHGHGWPITDFIEAWQWKD